MMSRSVAPLFLRLAIGPIFLFHGSMKLFLTPAAAVAFFEKIGLPGFFAPVVGAVEVAAGLALILGLGTRLAAAALSLILLGALFKVKLRMGFVTPQGPGWEFDLALLGGTLSLLVSGAGRYSLEELLSASDAAEV